ncbi:hypothetical protein PY650_33630 [Rhizobium calliandrae]|uniref:Uncharacterized protein n=1 Tax=Rhizobium calliandrae TaxID=1312182 RepID=A0ABT7KP92_9HYPH|nr:hypothetical protein [Rhizobium calliandrae]MDL2410442.1 hypothetical protein [Rhizobium calliandrae]
MIGSFVIVKGNIHATAHGMRIVRIFRRELKYGYAVKNARLHYFRQSYVEVCDLAALLAGFKDGAKQNCRQKISSNNNYIRLWSSSRPAWCYYYSATTNHPASACGNFALFLYDRKRCLRPSSIG